jgi:hypothetical protein
MTNTNQSTEYVRCAHWRDHYVTEMARVGEDLRYAESRHNAIILPLQQDGTEIDATPEYIASLRNAYDDYRAEAQFWTAEGEGSVVDALTTFDGAQSCAPDSG